MIYNSSTTVKLLFWKSSTLEANNKQHYIKAI